MTDLEEWNADEAEFDPARRRRRHGRMPAGLRRYWAARRGIKYHPARRRRRHGVRHVVYDPAHRRRRGRRHFRALFDPMRRRHSFRRRRYDFGSPGGWINAASDPFTITAGGWFHNFLVHKVGIGAKTYGIPFLSSMTGANVTQVGIVAGALAILGKKFGWFGPTVHNFLGGIFSEGFNNPAVEQVTRSNVGGGAQAPGGLSAGGAAFPVGPYSSPSNRSISMANIEGIAPPNYAYAEPAMGVQSVSPDGTPTAPTYVPVWAYT